PFLLGANDQAENLHISQKLYGREQELQQLLVTYERASTGPTELLLVAGYSGIGKSVLINEIHKPVISQRGAFISGKFDQYTRNLPYTAISQAFQSMIAQILREDDTQRETWHKAIMKAVGANGQLLIDLIPELESLIGPQPLVPPLGPTETQNRFNLLFRAFVGVFAKPEHPLALFLDDLQWVDIASLKLIFHLLTDDSCRNLLLIGAYRNNEVTDAHALMVTVDELQQAEVPIQTITLQPLDHTSVQQLLTDTLVCTQEAVTPLAKLVHTKTGGNPFFINQFLRALYEGRLLNFNISMRQWQWDVDQIQAAPFTDNVVDLMTTKISRLSISAQQVLTRAACIGNRFDLNILALVQQSSMSAVINDLGEAISEGLVIPGNASYLLTQHDTAYTRELTLTHDYHEQITFAFLHDRVQQAAYSLIPDEQKSQTHLMIGRQIRNSTPPEAIEEHVFAIISQLNRGITLITDQAEQIDLARLNMIGGHRAKVSNAYESAAEFFALTIKLLGDVGWEQHYELMFEAHRNLAESYYLCGRIDIAETLFATTLQKAQTISQQSEIYILRMALYTSLGRYSEGIALGLESLKPFGLSFPETTEERIAAINTAMQSAMVNLGDRPIESLLDIPPLENPEQQMLMRLFMAIIPMAYSADSNLFVLITVEMVNISLRYGNTDSSAYAYAICGMILASVVNDYTKAHGFGKMAIQLNERIVNADLRGRIRHIFASFIMHWQDHIRDTIPYLREAYLNCLSVGDLLYAGFAGWMLVMNQFYYGNDLGTVMKELKKTLDFVNQTNNETVSTVLTVLRETITSLQMSDHNALNNETQYALKRMEEFNLTSGLNMVQICMLQTHVIYGRYREAQEVAELAQQTVAINATVYCATELPFYHLIALTALYEETPVEARPQVMATIEQHYKQMQHWAVVCPANFVAKEALMAAEIARIRGEHMHVVEQYDRAIEAAQLGGFTHIEALASELAAHFHMARGYRRISKIYLTEAYNCYGRWGATAKANMLLEKFPDMLTPATVMPNRRGQTTSRTSSTTFDTTAVPINGGDLLDLMAVIKAAQAISSEIVLERLLKQLMKLAVENAGAQKGVLVLEEQGRLQIEALITVDPDMVQVGVAQPLEGSSSNSNTICRSVVQYVVHHKETLVLREAMQDLRFAEDPYIIRQKPRSVLCMPLSHQGQMIGVLYLENNLASDAFTPARLDLLRMLAAQAVIALENAKLYAQIQQQNQSLETNIALRTAELREINDRLQHELAERQRIEAERTILQEEVIRGQAATLAELSTPLIPITDRIMVMPLIGTMDSQRAQQVLSTVLQGAAERRAEVVIMDITGIPVVDTAVANSLVHAAQSLRLLGAKIIITGIRPEVAQTLVGLGIDLSLLTTLATLQMGIINALRQSGELALTPTSRTKLTLHGRH
ncbi:MAG: AAA family ATPase, partial [Oscillochloris sp.]|nr:AAA family ATPase [Oscillochloris sp.]